jgi:hypothetical protein
MGSVGTVNWTPATVLAPVAVAAGFSLSMAVVLVVCALADRPFIAQRMAPNISDFAIILFIIYFQFFGG